MTGEVNDDVDGGGEVLMIGGEAVDLREDRLRLPVLDPALEAVTTALGLASAGALLALWLGLVPSYVLAPLGATLACAALAWRWRTTMVADRGEGLVWFERRLLGADRACSAPLPLARIRLVTVDGEEHARRFECHWTYAPAFVLRDGSIVRLAEAARGDRGGLERSDRTAGLLAAWFGARHLAGKAERVLECAYDEEARRLSVTLAPMTFVHRLPLAVRQALVFMGARLFVARLAAAVQRFTRR